MPAEIACLLSVTDPEKVMSTYREFRAREEAAQKAGPDEIKMIGKCHGMGRF